MDNGDSKSERDKLATAKLNAAFKESQKRMALIDQFGSALNKFVKIALETSQSERESVMKNQLTYKKQLTETVDSIPLDKALELLNSAKSSFKRYISDANIRRVDSSVAASNIEVIIDPLIEEVKSKIEAQLLIQKLNNEKLSNLNLPTDRAINLLIEGAKKKIADKVVIQELQNGKPSSLNLPKEKVTESDEFKKEPDKYFLPDGFTQISCRASKKEIQDYFYILTQEKNELNDRPFMSKKEVDFLLEKNFSAFECKPVGRMCQLNLADRQKAVLRYFLYEFYLRYESGVVPTKRKYVNFLIWNFEIFKDDNPDILNGNMNSSKKPKKYRIPIEKYLDK